jgi:hypothetical protein
MPTYAFINNFIISNQENFQTNSSIHNINTWNKHHLHRPNANLSCLKRIHSTMESKFKQHKENTYTPFTLQMNFLCVKMIYNTVFLNVYNTLHCKNCVYLRIFSLFYILLSF